MSTEHKRVYGDCIEYTADYCSRNDLLAHVSEADDAANETWYVRQAVRHVEGACFVVDADRHAKFWTDFQAVAQRLHLTLKPCSPSTSPPRQSSAFLCLNVIQRVPLDPTDPSSRTRPSRTAYLLQSVDVLKAVRQLAVSYDEDTRQWSTFQRTFLKQVLPPCFQPLFVSVMDLEHSFAHMHEVKLLGWRSVYVCPWNAYALLSSDASTADTLTANDYSKRHVFDEHEFKETPITDLHRALAVLTFVASLVPSIGLMSDKPLPLTVHPRLFAGFERYFLWYLVLPKPSNLQHVHSGKTVLKRFGSLFNIIEAFAQNLRGMLRYESVEMSNGHLFKTNVQEVLPKVPLTLQECLRLACSVNEPDLRAQLEAVEQRRVPVRLSACASLSAETVVGRLSQDGDLVSVHMLLKLMDASEQHRKAASQNKKTDHGLAFLVFDHVLVTPHTVRVSMDRLLNSFLNGAVLRKHSSAAALSYLCVPFNYDYRSCVLLVLQRTTLMALNIFDDVLDRLTGKIPQRVQFSVEHYISLAQALGASFPTCPIAHKLVSGLNKAFPLEGIGKQEAALDKKNGTTTCSRYSDGVYNMFILADEVFTSLTSVKFLVDPLRGLGGSEPLLSDTARSFLPTERLAEFMDVLFPPPTSRVYLASELAWSNARQGGCTPVFYHGHSKPSSSSVPIFNRPNELRKVPVFGSPPSTPKMTVTTSSSSTSSVTTTIVQPVPSRLISSILSNKPKFVQRPQASPPSSEMETDGLVS